MVLPAKQLHVGFLVDVTSSNAKISKKVGGLEAFDGCPVKGGDIPLSYVYVDQT